LVLRSLVRSVSEERQLLALGSRAATIATHANGPIAWRAIGGMFFFRHAEVLFILGLMVTWMPLLISLWRRRRSSHN